MIKDDPSFSDGHYEASSDAFNHEVFADIIHRIIYENAAPLAIGLFGGWGVGKTSIINLLKRKLSIKEDAYVYFNAWEYGEDTFRRQFLLAIANSEDIIKNKKDRETLVNRLERLNHSDIRQKSIENIGLSKVGLLKLGVFFIISAIGIYLIIHGGYTKSFSTLGTGIFALLASIVVIIYQRIEQTIKVTVDESYDPKLIFPEQFASEFDKLIDLAKTNNNKKRVIIVIDDLDRCEADTIKNILVTMKTFLSRKECFFIIPMDDSSVVRIFKSNHNFGYEQLRKYFSISIRIPELHFDDLIDFAEKIAKQYDVPADVTFIAALGYCTDARKMKHFLNLYKVKEAIAFERKEKGYLGTIELQAIKKQLAKIVVLEYQYPEVYRFLTKHPEELDKLTDLAYDREIKSIINYEEIDDTFTSTNFWNCNPGLKEFLQKTNYIGFDDFDTLSKLKVPNQEKELSSIKQILTAGNLIEFENVDRDILFNNSSHLLQLLKRYLNISIQTIKERAFDLSVLVIRGKYLNTFQHNELVSEVINTIWDSRNNLKISERYAVDLLDNFEVIGRYRKLQLVNKLENDLFQFENQLKNFSNIINHQAFPDVIEIRPNLNQIIKNKLDSDIANISNNEQKYKFLNEINLIKYDLKEREKYHIEFPTPEIVINAISLLPELLEKFNLETFNILRTLILSKNNPFEFEKINLSFSKKVAVIFNNHILDYSYNDLFKNLSQLLIDSPGYLEENDAISIANSIGLHFSKFEDNSKLELLFVYLKAIFSIRENKKYKDTFLQTYNSFVDNLKYDNFKEHNNKLEETFSGENQVIREVITENIIRKWALINSSFDNPNEELLKYADYCSQLDSFINGEKIKLLLLNILSTNIDSTLSSWNPFILNKTLLLSQNDQLEIQKKTLSILLDSSIEEKIREINLQLFLELAEKTNKETFSSDIKELINLLSNDDFVIHNFIANNVNQIIEIFGSDVFMDQVNRIFNDILEKNNIDLYNSSIDVCFRFKDQIIYSSWERLVSKFESEINNEILSFEHKKALLNLCAHIPELVGYQRVKLSETLFYLKDNHSDNEIKAKAWEVYQVLKANEIIDPIIPPELNTD